MSEPVRALGAGPAAELVRDLVAWSVEVDDPGDLLSWLPAGDAFAFLRGGDGVVGWGEAVRLPSTSIRSGDRLAADVASLLSRITVRDDVGLAGSGPVALASLTFDPAAGGSVVVVPRVVLGRREGRSWLTLVTPPGAVQVPALRRRPVTAAKSPSAAVAADVPSEADWAVAVATAVSGIRAGELDKVVLARALDVRAESALDGRAVASRLAVRFPGCFTFLCDGLVGASPELLVRRQGRHAESLVLAGTVRRSADPDEDAELEQHLLHSAKDAGEHGWAAESVRTTLAGLAVEVEADTHPQLLRLANVSHLATHVSAWLPADPPSALALAAALHPTAAVGGTPTDAALAMIRELEAAPRDRYAGPVGWVDARGDGEFALALRCAHLSGEVARLWAGAGIVADSDPAAEVAETTVKFDAVLSALT
jgi:menaquinone-specific isochorismate synthase